MGREAPDSPPPKSTQELGHFDPPTGGEKSANTDGHYLHPQKW